ncbi:hypothetical protein G7Y89_g13168 [Cudoniella acicularis]|uniref:Ribosomal RNA-processing protein 8 n=1 Tax=Cudoniella acicularis TaxID=354080 RepID=A0A8H4VWP2_9HELO|nr:hypothetical protein G7Y89_g13168 [Cudoniella acicularis]
MFAVPGWAVSPNLLKTQTLDSSKPAKSSTGPNPGTETSKPNKKRKRSSSKSKAQDVNSSNVADLWEIVIEGKQSVKSNDLGEKRQKIPEDVLADVDAKVGSAGKEKARKAKTLKEKKREKKRALQDSKFSNESTDAKPPSEAILTTTQQQPAKATPQLTPLQASMRQKLISARFRHLNQTLYTTPSAHSLSLFEQNPEMFTEYHEGFRRQVDVWPENPVDGYIRNIKTRGRVRGPARNNAAKASGPPSDVALLPRTEGICHIADLGCGDAALSAVLQADSKKLKLKIHSFDLYSPSPLVTRADIADLPLEDSSVDVAIFCLALMGTNWIDFIEEAFRILRWKGELWVAEIKSRFGRVGGKNTRVEHSVGNRQKKSAAQGKKEKRKAEDEEAAGDDAALMVEVDGNDDVKQETDVNAFVEVLRKRGFVLKVEWNGEKAIDLSNKMFVRMHFMKGLTPIKGKCVPEPKGMKEMGLETWKKKSKAKFLDTEEDSPVSSEASVLKPCVYKLR